MKAVCAFLALGFVASASAYFSDGKHDPKDSFLLFARAVLIEFDGGNKEYVVQFNTCKHLDVTIDQVELMQFRGKEMQVETVKGGQGSHLVGLKLSGGEGEANFEFIVWGKWKGQRKLVDHEESYKIGREWKDC